MVQTGVETVKTSFAIVDIRTLLPHELVDDARVAALAAAIEKDGRLERAIIADRATNVVLDGHHRYYALQRLGATKAPVVFVDYSDPAIVVESWRTGERPPTKDEVIAHALARKPFPAKTTKHPALYAVEEAGVPLDKLW